MLAEYLIDNYTHGMRQMMDANVASARWITTSLLAINGGGAVAILGQAMATDAKLVSSFLFASGILSALASAHLGIKAATKVLAPMGNAIGYWISVKQDGYRVENLEGHETDMNALVKKETKIPALLGYASVAFFTGGLIAAAVGMAGLT